MNHTPFRGFWWVLMRELAEQRGESSRGLGGEFEVGTKLLESVRIG